MPVFVVVLAVLSYGTQLCGTRQSDCPSDERLQSRGRLYCTPVVTRISAMLIFYVLVPKTRLAFFWHILDL